MAAAPFWKVYDAEGNYEAACKTPESAAALVAFLGDKATIRFDHSKKCVVWTEGADGQAAESYDAVAIKCQERLDAFRSAIRERRAAWTVERL